MAVEDIFQTVLNYDMKGITFGGGMSRISYKGYV